LTLLPIGPFLCCRKSCDTKVKSIYKICMKMTKSIYVCTSTGHIQSLSFSYQFFYINFASQVLQLVMCKVLACFCFTLRECFVMGFHDCKCHRKPVCLSKKLWLNGKQDDPLKKNIRRKTSIWWNHGKKT